MLEVWEQAEIDKLTVETLDGTKNERGWSKTKPAASETLALSTTVCREGVAAIDVLLFSYISKLAGMLTDRFMMPTSYLNVTMMEVPKTIAWRVKSS